MYDLFYRLLPKQRDDTPFLVNTFLPVFTLTGYITQNIPVNVIIYDDLETSIIDYSKKNKFHLKGEFTIIIQNDFSLKKIVNDNLYAKSYIL